MQGVTITLLPPQAAWELARVALVDDKIQVDIIVPRPGVSPPPSPPCRHQPQTPLPDLVREPLAGLKARLAHGGPVQVWSPFLQDSIWVAGDEATIHRLLAEGRAAYYPEELEVLAEAVRSVPGAGGGSPGSFTSSTKPRSNSLRCLSGSSGKKRRVRR